MNIDYIIKQLKIQYYKNLIDNMNKEHIMSITIVSYYNLLLEDSLDIIKTSSESETKSFFENTELYKKSWSKLNIIHKIIKIKEFVNRLDIISQIEKTELINLLIDLLKSNKLSKKDIYYDEINGVILSIPNLLYNNNKYTYSI